MLSFREEINFQSNLELNHDFVGSVFVLDTIFFFLMPKSQIEVPIL